VLFATWVVVRLIAGHLSRGIRPLPEVVLTPFVQTSIGRGEFVFSFAEGDE